MSSESAFSMEDDYEENDDFEETDYEDYDDENRSELERTSTRMKMVTTDPFSNCHS